MGAAENFHHRPPTCPPPCPASCQPPASSANLPCSPCPPCWLPAAVAAGAATAARVAAAPTPSPLVVSGVVSVGAAVGAASVSLLDASGQALGTATAHPVDGSYRITLSTSSPPLPLFLQAQGTDAGGRPVLLHSLVPSLGSTGATAHITPLTQAVAALALGQDPQAAFAKPQEAALPSTTALLTPAADFLKTLLKSPLADVKISDATKLDLLSDSGFATPKSAADLLLESTRVQVEPQSGRLQPEQQIPGQPSTRSRSEPGRRAAPSCSRAAPAHPPPPSPAARRSPVRRPPCWAWRAAWMALPAR